MNIYRKFKAWLQLRDAVRQADKAHGESGDRFFVLPAAGGKLIVTDRRNFRILKRKHYIDKSKTVSDMERGCFYATPGKGGTGAISAGPRMKYFYKWKERFYERRKAQ